ncbi:MAG: HAD-IB family hydrolase [Actinomycetota bacterium]|nr:HAD-IB family hydrolase [Actinomycetota bacterium]
MTEENVIAFFDLDHTLLDGSSGEMFVRFMVDEGYMPRRSLLRVFYYGLLYKMNRLGKESLYGGFVEWMEGYSLEEIKEITDRCFELCIARRLYKKGPELIARHRRMGHLTVIATATTDYMAKKVMTLVGAEDVIAASLGANGDSEILAPFMEGKLRMVRDYCSRHGASLSNCYFYSDSMSDFPLLEAVGHPVMVNPQLKLRCAARGRGWPILRFREHLCAS